VNVAINQSFGTLRAWLSSPRLPGLLAQYRNRFFQIALASTNAERQSLNPAFVLSAIPLRLGWNFHGCIRCTHPFSLSFLHKFSNFIELLQNGPPRMHRGGPEKFSYPR